MTRPTLTDRYVYAAMRTVPEKSRADLSAELRASIADQVEARTGSGENPAAAEKAVLTDLGDPDILAAGYTDRPLRLIGPRYFLLWWRLLKLLLWIVVPIVAAAFVVAQVLEGAPVESIIGAAWGVSISVAAHLFTWVTVVFAIIDRAEVGKKEPVVPWSVDSLPALTHSGTGRSDLISALVLVAIAVGVLIWDRFVGFIPGYPGPIVNPELWPAGALGLFAIMGAGAVLAVWVYRRGRWTAPLAAINTVLDALVMVPLLVLLSRGELFNPVMIARASAAGIDGTALTVLAALAAGVIVGSALADVIDAWVRVWRSRNQRAAS